MFEFHYPYRITNNRPGIPIAFKSKYKTTSLIEGLIDTGATFILINLELSNDLQLQLKDWEKNCKSAQGQFKTAKATVDLIIGHAKRRETFEDVEIRVSEFKEYPELPLIGRCPLFEWYNVYFDNRENRYHLTPK